MTPEPGKWYYVNTENNVIRRAQCKALYADHSVMKGESGYFRMIFNGDIKGECEDPRFWVRIDPTVLLAALIAFIIGSLL